MSTSFVDTLKNHWLSFILSLVITTIGLTYGVIDLFIIEDKNQKISDLKETVSKLEDELQDYKKNEELKINEALSEKTIKQGESISVFKNQISLFADLVDDNEVILLVSSFENHPQTIKLTPENSLQVISNGEGKLLVNLLRVRGNMVDITISDKFD